MRYHLQWVYIKPSRWHTNRYKYIDRSIWDYDGKSLFYIPFSIINERLSEDIILYKERKGIKQRAIGLNNQAFSLINQVYIFEDQFMFLCNSLSHFYLITKAVKNQVFKFAEVGQNQTLFSYFIWWRYFTFIVYSRAVKKKEGGGGGIPSYSADKHFPSSINVGFRCHLLI